MESFAAKGPADRSPHRRNRFHVVKDRNYRLDFLLLLYYTCNDVAINCIFISGMEKDDISHSACSKFRERGSLHRKVLYLRQLTRFAARRRTLSRGPHTYLPAETIFSGKYQELQRLKPGSFVTGVKRF